VDWQQEVIKLLADNDNIVLYNPRKASWDKNAGPEAVEKQILWELEMQDKVDLVLMNILPGSQSPICLLELGLHLGQKKPIMLACSEGYWRYTNVRVTAQRYMQDGFAIWDNSKPGYLADIAHELDQVYACVGEDGRATIVRLAETSAQESDDKVDRIVCAISDIAQFADDLAEYASEQLCTKVSKRDILTAIADIIIHADETGTPVKELLQDACEKALKKAELDHVCEKQEDADTVFKSITQLSAAINELLDKVQSMPQYAVNVEPGLTGHDIIVTVRQKAKESDHV
jgi:uncharacterized protein YoxC